jgi:D-amino-acid dehydrogenase
MATDTTVVIGGGVIGLACAYELAASGRQVHVLERGSIGRGASTGNAGWVTLSQCFPVPSPGSVREALRSAGRPDSPLYVRPAWSSELVRWLWQFRRHSTASAFERGTAALAAFAEHAFEAFEEWEKNGVDTSLTRPGLLHAFLDEGVATRSRELQARASQGRYQVPDQPLSGDAARLLEPALSPAVRAAYLVPDEGLVDPRTLVASLAGQVAELGGAIEDRTAVTRLVVERGRVVEVVAGETSIPCEAVVIAAGAWSGDLLGSLGAPVLLQAGKGYSFSVHLPTPPRQPILLADRHVAVSPLGATTRIAGTMEFSGNNLRLDWRRIEAIARASRHYLGVWFGATDELVGLISDPWVGGRPMLPDGLPLVDRVPRHENAYVATGHGMLGVTLAPATAVALTEYVTTGVRPDVLAPFACR